MANPFLLDFSKGSGLLVQICGRLNIKGFVLVRLFHSVLLAFCSPAAKKKLESLMSLSLIVLTAHCHYPGRLTRLLNHCNKGYLSHAHLSISLSYFFLSFF